MREKYSRDDYVESIGFLLIGFSIYELIFKRAHQYERAYGTPVAEWLDSTFGQENVNEYLGIINSITLLIFISGCMFMMQFNERRFWSRAYREDVAVHKSYERTRYSIYAIQIMVTFMAYYLYGFDNALCLALGFIFIDASHA